MHLSGYSRQKLNCLLTLFQPLSCSLNKSSNSAIHQETMLDKQPLASRQVPDFGCTSPPPFQITMLLIFIAQFLDKATKNKEQKNRTSCYAIQHVERIFTTLLALGNWGPVWMQEEDLHHGTTISRRSKQLRFGNPPRRRLRKLLDWPKHYLRHCGTPSWKLYLWKEKKCWHDSIFFQ